VNRLSLTPFAARRSAFGVSITPRRRGCPEADVVEQDEQHIRRPGGGFSSVMGGNAVSGSFAS